MKVYLDIGNTNIKISYGDNILRFKTKEDYSSSSLFSMFPDELKKAKIEFVIGSNVVPNLRRTLEMLFNQNYGVKIKWLEIPLKTEIKFSVDEPKSVGSDLVSIASYAANHFEDAIIINLGTATTISHIENKTFKGVIIAPGIGTQYNSLIKDADQLQHINLSYQNKSIGTNTNEALSIGIINGHAEMIKGLLSKICNTDNVIISGGAAYLVKDYIEAEYVEEVTIQGLKVIGELNEL